MSADGDRRARRSRRNIAANPDDAIPRHGSAFVWLRQTPGSTFLGACRQSNRLTLSGAVRAELRRMRFQRSTWVLLLIVMLLQPLSTILAVWSARGMVGLDRGSGCLLANLLHTPMAVNWLAGASGLFPGMIVAGILGVLAVTREFSDAAIESTLMANPRRGMVLMAKGLALALLIWLAAQVGLLFSWILETLLPSGRSGPLPADKSGLVLIDLLGGPLMLALFALMGLGLGALSRSKVGGISLVLGLTLILPLILGLLWGPGAHAAGLQILLRLMPASLLGTFLSGLNRATEAGGGWWPTWWQAGLIMAAWTALCCALGTLVFRRADIN